jgi:hypothetical protein
MFCRTSKEVVMVEVEIDDLSFPVNRQTSDVVSDIAIPCNWLGGAFRAEAQVTPIAKRAGGFVLPFGPLITSQRVNTSWPLIVSIPKARDQGHKKQ